ncbi:hypothetical protein LTR53_012253 [Teratosphaeriaceae sp. CCFEE 6253]|nr:hypothetical protein LTR53_012253 [Teratosphaeriaceae sp. CCFEE 6253]
MGRAIKPSGGGRQQQPSIAVALKKQQKEALRTGNMPHDNGLLPDTLIMPTGRHLPGWYADFRTRLKLERTRAWARATDYWATLVFAYWLVRPRPALDRRRVPTIARDLHREASTRLAEGNLAPIEARLCEGFLMSLRTRIAQRAPDRALKWTLHKYLGPPKTVSYKATMMPIQPGEQATQRNGCLQAVVRIRSLQSLRQVRKVSTKDAGGKVVGSREVFVDAAGRVTGVVGEEGDAVPGGAKETTEHLVVQKSIRVGKASPWMVWGTTEETSMDALRAEWKRAAKVKQAAKAAKAGRSAVA